MRCALLAWVGLGIGVVGSGASENPPRPLRVDDLFEIEAAGRYYGGPVAFSPDGISVAFNRGRPKKTLLNHKWEYLWGNDGADIWLQAVPGREPVNLTNGQTDGSGWWAPQWSPDGRFLAMLSTKGGDNVRLFVWDKNTGQMRQLTGQGVDLVEVRSRPFVWVDARHLLCPVLPEGEKPRGMSIELQSQELATTAWAKTPLGKEATASVLDSGVPVNLEERPQGRLLLIDAMSGEPQVVVPASTKAWQLAPTGQAVAYCRQLGAYQPKAGESLPFAPPGVFGVEIRSLAGEDLLGAMPCSDVLPESLRWSPDGRELAFLGYAGSREKPAVLHRVNLDTKQVRQIELSDLEAAPVVRQEPQLEWTAQGNLLLLAAQRQGGQKLDVRARRDWWLFKTDGPPQCLTQSLSSVPAELWPQTGHTAFVGLAEGKLWQLDANEGQWRQLTRELPDKIDRLAWPARTNTGADEYPLPGRTYDQVIIADWAGDAETFRMVDLRSHQVRLVPKPEADANLAAFSPQAAVAVFTANNRQGAHVWRTDVRGGGTEALMSANYFLREVAEGEFRSIEYLSLDGEKLKGWLLLPPGYEPGKRYPLLTWVYAGSVARDKPSVYDRVGNPGALSKQIPAANGFIVLIPSMPLNPEGESDDPMLRLPHGVLPAVDKAIEMGVADPERVFVMGQSFGGFSTYGLVTQTKRFKAAVALAGLSNFISLYAQFDARLRYTDYPHENLFQAALMEAAQIRMGNPPWKDLGRYVRNSPVFQVHQVQTPLLIMQGDMDYVALQQGEEFFFSLYRQGKRARFVRYWGEGHVLESPANIRDMWAQTFSWFDEHGDIARDAKGELLWDGDRVQSRKGAPPLKPEDYLKFERMFDQNFGK